MLSIIFYQKYKEEGAYTILLHFAVVTGNADKKKKATSCKQI
jgi:hypothetical protein